MTTQIDSAVTVGANEDNWAKTQNTEANKWCPKGPFVWIPSIINGVARKTKWWTNYWWGMNKWGKGVYVNEGFDSCFDPRAFYESTNDGLKLKAFYDENWINQDDGQKYPSWVTSEIVLGGIDDNDYNLAGFGHYAVVAKTDDFGALDPHVVLGIFTYQFGKADQTGTDSNCPNLHREIDLLETISTAEQGLKGNAQFALQPASNKQPDGESLLRFTIPKNTPCITAYLNWGDRMRLSSTQTRIYAGDYSLAQILGNSPPSPIPGGDWNVGFNPNDNGYASRFNIPMHRPGVSKQRMHINFYVPAGLQRADKTKVHTVYISRFEYTQTTG